MSLHLIKINEVLSIARQFIINFIDTLIFALSTFILKPVIAFGFDTDHRFSYRFLQAHSIVEVHVNVIFSFSCVYGFHLIRTEEISAHKIGITFVANTLTKESR